MLSCRLPVSERCNNKTLSAAKELVHVREVDVSDADDATIFVLFEVESRLFEPFEIVDGFHVEFDEVLEYVFLVNVNRDERFELRPLHLRQLLCRLVNQLAEKLAKLLTRVHHNLLVASRVANGDFRVTCPQHLDAKETDLCGEHAFEFEKVEGWVVDGDRSVAKDTVNRSSRCIQQVHEPSFHVTLQKHACKTKQMPYTVTMFYRVSLLYFKGKVKVLKARTCAMTVVSSGMFSPSEELMAKILS